MTVFFEILHWQKYLEIFQVYKKLFYAISDICVRYSNPSLFCAIFATCFCVIYAIRLSTGLNPNPNHNRMVLSRVKKEVEVVFHPSTTYLYVCSITKYVPWHLGAERNKSNIMMLRYEIFH